jgi:GNAT superfamily N-acetyltransferase
MLCVAWPRSGQPGLALRPEPDVAHPRIARAMRYRDDVRAWRTEGGVVLVGRGVASRSEVAIEVDPGYRGHGLGRALAAAARYLVPDNGPVWAQIAPANAASVRAFLAAGFRPVGAEALLTHGELGV